MSMFKLQISTPDGDTYTELRTKIEDGYIVVDTENQVAQGSIYLCQSSVDVLLQKRFELQICQIGIDRNQESQSFQEVGPQIHTQGLPYTTYTKIKYSVH